MRTAAALFRSLALVAGAVVGGALVLAPRAARAQANQLTLTSSTSLTIPQPTIAAYDTLRSEGATLTFTVAHNNPGGSGVERIATVKIRCVSVSGGSKTCADVQYRSTLPATTAWTDISTSFTTVVARCVNRDSATPPPAGECTDAPGIGEPWNGNVQVRMKLNWTTDAPATYIANVELTLEVYEDP